MIVILGSGLSEWLFDGTSSRFHAASHGVKRSIEDSQTRSIMARMKVIKIKPKRLTSWDKSSKS